MAQPQAIALPPFEGRGRDVSFAIGIVIILSILFLPIPAFLIDIGLAFSIALSVLILMVALWIHKPLDFSSFPTILLIATMTRLSLNIATTRIILSEGHEGTTAAGYVISGFSQLVMSGDFVIGLIVFLILVVVNFIVITKGATRIAEVGARFTLDAIPGKQMSIDADLSAGLIDEKTAQQRRRELEDESSFFGSMDGASKFVRGDAIAGLIITAINIFGGIIIGYTRHDMEIGQAADVFTKLSVGDGLVSQIPALIVSLAAGLLVSRGGNLGSTDEAVLGQLSGYPRALFVAAGLMTLLAVVPGLPFFPFVILGGAMAFAGWFIPRQLAQRAQAVARRDEEQKQLEAQKQEKDSVKNVLHTAEVELCLGKQVSSSLLGAHQELAFRVGKMRKKFAAQYGFVVPEIKVTDDFSACRTNPTRSGFTERRWPPMSCGSARSWWSPATAASRTFRATRCANRPSACRRYRSSRVYVEDLKRDGFHPIDNISVVLTHLSEVIRNNLPQLLSYKDMKVAARPARSGIPQAG